MDKSSTDLIMRFVMKGGQDVLAEGVLDKDPKDTLMEGFEPADYDTYSNFFEISDFDFGLELKAEDKSANALSQGAGAGRGPQVGSSGPYGTSVSGQRLTSGLSGGPAGQPRVKQDEWSRWRSAVGEEAKKIAEKFQVEFQKMSFSRAIDRASPGFFMACCRSQPFDKAVLVKRVSRGDSGGKSRLPVGYMRIEFETVLITGVDWSDGDLVKEKIEFICQKMSIKLRKQADSGDVVEAGQTTATWERKQDPAGGSR